MTHPNEIAQIIVNEAFHVRSKLGFGLLESVYEPVLARRLSRTPVHFQQTLSYLKLTQCKLGLLIDFGAPSMREGIKRIVNKL